MNTMSVSKFKEQCLAILDSLGPEGLVITKHGKPVAEVKPSPVGHQALIGVLADKIKIKGNIFSTGISWDAE